MSYLLFFCENGDLINAKKYLKENPNIDIHAENDFAFRESCLRGLLENQDSLNKSGLLEVAQWLCTLCDNYYLEHDNKKIIKYKILTEQELEEKNFNKKIGELANQEITIDSDTIIDL